MQEFALKACIERFNARYYTPNSPPVPSISSPNPIMAGIPPGGGANTEGGGAFGDGGGSAEEDLPVPLDHNYLSGLSKKVRSYRTPEMRPPL